MAICNWLAEIFSGLINSSWPEYCGSSGRNCAVASCWGSVGWGGTLKISGATVAAMSLILGVIAEAIVVTYLAHKLGAAQAPALISTPELPKDLLEVWRFYAPLGITWKLAFCFMAGKLANSFLRI